LPDEDILQLLRNSNAGRPLFQTIYASKPQNDDYGARRESGEDDEWHRSFKTMAISVPEVAARITSSLLVGQRWSSSPESSHSSLLENTGVVRDAGER
jgi:hypothetical protein